jgi:molybdopterin molybdotransferase
MIEVGEAQTIVLQECHPLPATIEPLSWRVCGRILAEEVLAPRDWPASDKSLRDGYAVRSQDCSAGQVVLQVVGEIAAGVTATEALRSGQCMRIFTGAPLPAGADAVVMQEEVELLGDGHTVRLRGPVHPGQWIYHRGQEMRAGEIVLPAGIQLNPAAIGVLASLGRTTVRIYPAPRVGLAVTGNELLEPSQPWQEGKIYNSNGPMLEALLAQAGIHATNYGILQDDETLLRTALVGAIAECDVVILAGGMSVGAYDLVPYVLQNLGFVERIRQVRIKPGKPFLYARRHTQIVFGLPGNPGSTWVCFQLFVRPALRRMLGYAIEQCYPPLQHYPLSQPFSTTNDRPTYYPARLHRDGQQHLVQPLPWSGAPDLRALAQADGLIILPPGNVHYQIGELVPVLLVSAL